MQSIEDIFFEIVWIFRFLFVILSPNKHLESYYGQKDY